MSPPGEVEAGAPHHQDDRPTTTTRKINGRETVNSSHPSRLPRRATCYGTAWREGFGYGFRDALRLAARRTNDPAVWAMLARLPGDYDLASGDD